LASIYHLSPNDERLPGIATQTIALHHVHTSCRRTKNQLITLGIPPNKITVIPLGVDLSIFHPVKDETKQERKKSFGIPPDRFVIGSFQKDGVGWDKGNQPKLIKGPDIFVQTVTRLARHVPLHILLSGPARGYIEKSLAQAHIPYTSVGYLANHQDIAPLYQALDLYLITARVEGGPKQFLEAWASGIPVVSTPIGMITDIGSSDKNVLLSRGFLPDELAALALRLIRNQSLAHHLSVTGLSAIPLYSWPNIANTYFNELYQPLLKRYHL